MAVVVPYDTAGKDVYKLLHMMAFDHAPGAKLNEEIDYFEDIKRASDLMTDQEKEIIDKKGRSMVIISHPLSRLVNSWHHKFHHLGIEYDQGMKLVQKFNLTDLIDRNPDAEAIISLSSLVNWVIDRFDHNKLKDKHFATLINTIVPCKYHFAAVIHIERISKELPLLLNNLGRVDYLKNSHFANELKHVEKRALVRKVYSEQELKKLPLKQRVKLLKAYQEDMDILEYSFQL